MDEIIRNTGKITGIHTERIVLPEPFIEFATRFASMTGTVLLMSGGGLDCAGHHILGIKPWLSLVGRNREVAITVGDQTLCLKADPLETLRNVLSAFSLEQNDLPAPVAAGLFGYLSYDLKDQLEDLPRTSVDDLCLPHICFFAPSIIVIHDKSDDTTNLCIPERISSGRSNIDYEHKFFQEALASSPPAAGSFSGNTKGFRSNFTRDCYTDAIKQIKEYIASGDVYQVNMSQRFEMDFRGDTFSLFKSLYNINPAPFFAYINAGDHHIISTSPERFLLQKGNQVETRPIKGTRPRGKTPGEDKKLGLELRQSKKDEAELSMIVDLLRNDLGKISMAGSVRVTEHKRLEAYQNVYHLVSVVESTLEKDRNSVDLINASFPGGSITGCPKIRAMEIIDELEPNRRHIYTGSIGYISFHDTMDLSIAIRTATVLNGKIIFSVGGGIVFDSDPEDEYDETLHKGRTLMEVFQGKEKTDLRKNHVWINGAIAGLDQASVHVGDQGFQYGYGFFETIRVDKGEPQYLKGHIDRFNKAWEAFFPGNPPDVTWYDIITQVISKNDLTDKTAAVKIIASMGDREEAPFNYTLLVMARPYTHRLAGKKDQGLDLATYPEPRQTPMADHKTLNYLYYLLAGKWARAQGADEALIMNPDGTVSETNSAGILLIKDKTAISPISPHVLPGVMHKAIYEILVQWEYNIEEKKVRPEDLFSVDHVIISNSLMGAVPILSLDNISLEKSTSDLWRKINETLFF